MTVIKVPKTPKSAYNPKRPANNLLRAQIEHLEHAADGPTRALRRPVQRTEGEAARYIAELTARVLQSPPSPSPAAKPPRPRKPSRKKKSAGSRKTKKRRAR